MIGDVLNRTKVYCSEGGCGVCAVNATITDTNNNKTKTFSVNSVRQFLLEYLIRLKLKS